jgi:hypothetical protein
MIAPIRRNPSMNTDHAASAYPGPEAAYPEDAPIPYTLTPKAEAFLAALKAEPQPEPEPVAGA